MWLKELKKLPGQRKDPIHDPCVLLEGRNEPTVGLGLIECLSSFFAFLNDMQTTLQPGKVYVLECRCPRRPEEGTGSPGPGVKGLLKTSSLMCLLGTELGSSGRVVLQSLSQAFWKGFLFPFYSVLPPYF
ncbi:hypothetical protein LEMLEM_LOCUS4829 [Lemmus lemmus]